MMRRNECLDVVTAVLDEAGVPYIVKPGGKHWLVVFSINGRQQKIPCSLSSSKSWRAPHAYRAQTKRMVREARSAI
jgi:hypothetical protein